MQSPWLVGFLLKQRINFQVKWMGMDLNEKYSLERRVPPDLQSCQCKKKSETCRPV